MIRDFLLGVREYRLQLTTQCENVHAYERGREWAHRLTLRKYDN